MIKIVLILIALIVVLILALSVEYFTKRHGMIPLFWRFIAGHPLDGKHRTNATFIRRGDKVLHHSGKASRYAHLMGVEKAVIRIGSLTMTVIVVYGLIMSLQLTVISFTCAVIACIALNFRRIERKWIARYMTRGTVAPLSQAIALQWNTTPQIAQQNISIRPDYATVRGTEKIGTIILPDWYSASPMQQEMFTHLVKSRLSVELTMTWHTTRHPMTVEIFRAAMPPSKVLFADRIHVMDKLTDDKVYLGDNAQSENIFWDIAGEDPHLATQAPSRRGKTRLLLLIIAQIVNKGGSAMALDPKRVGIKDATAGVSEVTVWDNPKDIEASWDFIHQMKVLMDERIDQYEQDRTVQFKRKLLCIDEVSMWATMTRRHWEKIRPKKSSAKAPVWDDIAEILWMAAFVKINLLIMGQRLDQGLIAGLMESFGTRLASGYTPTAYNRFIGIRPMPMCPKRKGTFVLYDGESTSLIQTALGTDAELNDYARKGIKQQLETPTLKEIIDVTENRNA